MRRGWLGHPLQAGSQRCDCPWLRYRPNNPHHNTRRLNASFECQRRSWAAHVVAALFAYSLLLSCDTSVVARAMILRPRNETVNSWEAMLLNGDTSSSRFSETTISNNVLRNFSTRSLLVVTSIPGVAAVVHEATGFFMPLISTTHRRHEPNAFSRGS